MFCKNSYGRRQNFSPVAFISMQLRCRDQKYLQVQWFYGNSNTKFLQ